MKKDAMIFNFDTSYTALPELLFTKGSPERVANPRMVLLNESLAALLGLDLSKLTAREQAELFSGNRMPEGSTPYSQAYAGHQFGHFTMLGDGRAHVWGEHLTPANERFDLQFKGSGRTPYSRRGDGKAVLGPMLREYIISEAMYQLGIPTTRSLAVVTTGETIMRETALPGAILTRVASSHIRVGTFEFAAEQDNLKTLDALLDYTIQRHYPELNNSEQKALDLIRSAMEKQIDLIVHWMRVGFIHGVMNTDNMALSGETIDYGPCAFMDAYDPGTVFSSIDSRGRYAYANQPVIAQWNLARLAEALLPLIDDDPKQAVEKAEQLIAAFPEMYQQKWLSMMGSKLGLFDLQEGDPQLISDLLECMQHNRADYTNTFRDLTGSEQPDNAVYQNRPFREWYQRWQSRLEKNAKPLELSRDLMRNNNPAVIPRNHLVEQALDAAHEGDFQPTRDLLAVLEDPYSDKGIHPSYIAMPEPGERVYQTFCGT